MASDQESDFDDESVENAVTETNALSQSWSVLRIHSPSYTGGKIELSQ